MPSVPSDDKKKKTFIRVMVVCSILIAALLLIIAHTVISRQKNPIAVNGSNESSNQLEIGDCIGDLPSSHIYYVGYIKTGNKTTILFSILMTSRPYLPKGVVEANIGDTVTIFDETFKIIALEGNTLIIDRNVG